MESVLAVILAAASVSDAQAQGSAVGGGAAGVCKTLAVTGKPSDLFCRGTPRQTYVGALYPLGLGRHASSAEIDFWNQKFAADISLLPNTFVQTPEFKEQMVNIAVQMALGRQASPSEKKSWLERNLSFRDQMIALLTGPELSNQVPGDAAFIDVIYMKLTGKGPSDEQMSAAQGLLDQGSQMAPDLAAQVFDSHDAHKYLVEGPCGPYQFIFNRPPDPTGAKHWEDGLDGTLVPSVPDRPAYSGFPTPDTIKLMSNAQLQAIANPGPNTWVQLGVNFITAPLVNFQAMTTLARTELENRTAQFTIPRTFEGVWSGFLGSPEAFSYFTNAAPKRFCGSSRP